VVLLELIAVVRWIEFAVVVARIGRRLYIQARKYGPRWQFDARMRCGSEGACRVRLESGRIFLYDLRRGYNLPHLGGADPI